MRETERIIARWISGATGDLGSTTGATGRTVVVDSDEWIPVLLSSGMIDATAALIHRGSDPGVAAAGSSRTYTGTFTDPGAELIFADGFRLRQIRYGLADFTCLDAPTAFVLVDEHDFSAFLRDADNAWQTGVFANHVTHPLAVLANIAALGGPRELAGPDHRVYVCAEGSISTSPFGSPLGTAAERPAVVTGRWIDAHRSDPIDSNSLARVLPVNDRIDAIRERPWLGRYFEAIAVLRAIRGENLAPGRVSGFGGRLAGPGTPDTADAVGTPVLVQVGETVRAVDPVDGRWAALDPDQLGQAERELNRTATR